MAEIYEKYFKESFEGGKLTDIKLEVPHDFNFAYDVVDEIAKEHPEDVALVHKSCEGEKTVFTFDAMRRLSNKTANMLMGLGIKRGDRVMLILKRRYEFWLSMLAIHKIGAVAIPSSHMVSSSDIRERVIAASVKALICVNSEDIVSNVVKAVSEPSEVPSENECLNSVIKLCVGDKCEGFIDFDEAFAGCSEELSRQETQSSDNMLYYFTSGSSGSPKAVIHDFSYPIAHIYTAKYWHGSYAGGLHLTVADSGWAKSAWGKIYGQWFVRAAIMVYDYDQFYAEDMLKLLAQEKVNTFCAPPTIYKYLVREDFSKYDLSALKQATTAGEALPKEVAAKFFKGCGIKIREGFGQSETVLLICVNAGEEGVPESIGRKSTLFELKLIDEEGNEVATGEEGEIAVCLENGKAPTGMFKGYLNDKDKYDEVVENGVYHTKDMAYKDEAGNYFFVGRNDDVIKSSGYRIGPSEVEDVVNQHPAVFESAATGYPSKTRGYLVKASIVLKEGYEPSSELKTEIQEFVKERAAIYKYPRMIEFVDDLPRTFNGKINRAMIRKKDRLAQKK